MGALALGALALGALALGGVSKSCCKMRFSGTESATVDGRRIEAAEIARDRVPGAGCVELRWGALAPHRASSYTHTHTLDARWGAKAPHLSSMPGAAPGVGRFFK